MAAAPIIAALAVVLTCPVPLAATGPADAPQATLAVPGDDGVPLPLDHDGVPLRPLSDAELHRLLIAVSRTLEPAALRLARCHAEGNGYGMPGWRGCVERP